MGQHRAKGLVLGDRGVGAARLMRLEDGVGQDDAFVPDLDVAIGEFVGIGLFAHRFAGQILPDMALVAQTGDLGQSIRRDIQRPVQAIRPSGGETR